MKLQDYVFDYFNLIVKEYYLSLDKWSSDMEYVKLIKDEYEKIDKQILEEEAQEEIPEGLTKEMAESLLVEKETVLNRAYEQFNKLKVT